MPNFLKNDYEINKPKKINADEVVSRKISDTNFFSNLGTPFTTSTSSASGITESVITPGIRFLNFGCSIMKLYKSLEYNYNSVKTKFKNVENILNSYSNGNFNHIRKNIVKKSSMMNR